MPFQNRWPTLCFSTPSLHFRKVYDSGAPPSRSTIVKKITHRCEKSWFYSITMTSSTVRTSVRPALHVCQCDQYHASLQHTSLILDIHLLIDTCQNKVSADQHHVTKLKLTEVSCFLQLTADQVLVFDWIAGST